MDDAPFPVHILTAGGELVVGEEQAGLTLKRCHGLPPRDSVTVRYRDDGKPTCIGGNDVWGTL